MCHILFIHSSISRHLSCFYPMSTVANAMNTGILFLSTFIYCSSRVLAQVKGFMSHISLEGLVLPWFQFTCLSCEFSSHRWAPDKLRFCILFSFFSLWWWEWFLGAFSILSGNQTSEQCWVVWATLFRPRVQLGSSKQKPPLKDFFLTLHTIR